jgi:hypothetical protein
LDPVTANSDSINVNSFFKKLLLTTSTGDIELNYDNDYKYEFANGIRSYIPDTNEITHPITYLKRNPFPSTTTSANLKIYTQFLPSTKVPVTSDQVEQKYLTGKSLTFTAYPLITDNSPYNLDNFTIPKGLIKLNEVAPGERDTFLYLPPQLTASDFSNNPVINLNTYNLGSVDFNSNININNIFMFTISEAGYIILQPKISNFTNHTGLKIKPSSTDYQISITRVG